MKKDAKDAVPAVIADVKDFRMASENPIADKNRVFLVIPGFKEWVENTSLFRTISRFVGTGIKIDLIPHDVSYILNKGGKVEKAEDLPIEMLEEFYRNSPWYEIGSERKIFNKTD